MACATSSLPVPVSPSISTVVPVFDTCAIWSYTFCISCELPMMFDGRNRLRSSSRSRLFSSSSRSRSSSAARRSFTAWAIIEAMMVSRRSVLVQIGVGPVGQIDAQRSDDFLSDLDRNAHERGVRAFAPAGLVEEQRRFAGLRDDHRLAGEHDLAGHAFAELVAPAPRLLGRQPVRGLDQDVAGLPVEQGQRRVPHVHEFGERLEHRADDVAHVEALVEDAADVVEKRQLFELRCRISVRGSERS